MCIIRERDHGGVCLAVSYQDYICRQVSLDVQSVSWPAAFFVGGDGPVSAELAQLKGQMVAIEQADIQKKCGVRFQQAPPQPEPPPPTQ
jgi:hypothetical protein